MSCNEIRRGDFLEIFRPEGLCIAGRAGSVVNKTSKTCPSPLPAPASRAFIGDIHGSKASSDG